MSQEYLVHLNWLKLASNPCGLDNSTGRAADRYPDDASSNPARVNIFQLTSVVSDYGEKFLFLFISHFLLIFFQTPFKHEQQSSQRSKNALTKAEKREAKKGHGRLVIITATYINFFFMRITDGLIFEIFSQATNAKNARSTPATDMYSSPKCQR